MISNINIFAFIMLLFVAAHALAQISTPKESAPEKIDRPEATRALQVAMPQTAQEAVDLPTAPDVATVSTAITSDSTPRESREPNLQLLLSSETRYIETDLVNRKSMEGASLFDVAASGTLAIDPTLRLNFDVAAERMNDQSVFFPRVVTAQWMPWRWTSAEVGQFFIPVGFYVERDQWFSALPHYYRQILYWERGSDIGARFSVSPWPSGVLSAEASTFSGRTTRPGDQRPGPPEKAPQLISLRSHSSYHEVFVQHFAHQVAFGRQMNATGVGFGVFYEFKEWRLRPELWTEGFEIRQKQTQGPHETTFAFSSTAQLRFRFINVGALWAQSRGTVKAVQINQPLDETIERTLFGDLYLHRYFRIRAERREVVQVAHQVDDFTVRAILEIQAL